MGQGSLGLGFEEELVTRRVSSLTTRFYRVLEQRVRVGITLRLEK